MLGAGRNFPWQKAQFCPAGDSQAHFESTWLGTEDCFNDVSFQDLWLISTMA